MLFNLGPLPISETVVTTWAVMLGLLLISWLSARRLKLEPGPWQVALEGVVGAIQDAIEAVLPEHALIVLPFVGFAMDFCGVRQSDWNHSRTAWSDGRPVDHFGVGAAWFFFRCIGMAFGFMVSRRYLRHYLEPNPILLPFHIVSEISRTVALAVRLFGNIFSLEMAALLILLVAGFLVPVPVLLLHIVEALVQAYIFGMLALIYIAGGIQSLESKRERDEGAANA